MLGLGGKGDPAVKSRLGCDKCIEERGDTPKSRYEVWNAARRALKRLCRQPQSETNMVVLFQHNRIGHPLLFRTGGSASTPSAPNPLPSLKGPTRASTRASFNRRNLSIRLSPGNAGIGSTSLQLPRLLLPCSPHMLTL